MKTLRLTALAAAIALSLAGCASTATLDDTNSNSSTASGGAGTDATASPNPVPSPESTVEPDASAPVVKIGVGCESPAVTKAMKKAGIEIVGAPQSNREPTPGSTRDIAQSNKGTVCLWDIGDDYIGAWWTHVDSAAWNDAEKAITEGGGVITEIPGIDVPVAYFSYADRSDNSPDSSWTLDALYGSTWIHLTSTVWTAPEEGVDAFKAAVKIAKISN